MRYRSIKHPQKPDKIAAPSLSSTSFFRNGEYGQKRKEFSITTYLLVFVVGITSGFLGSTVGSGAMIVLPLLISLGLSPQVAVGTTKVGDVGTFALAIRNYFRSANFDKKAVIPLSCLAAVGAIIGATVLINLPDKVLKPYIAVTILACLPFILMNNDRGMKRVEVSRLRWAIGMLGFFFVSVNSAIVPAGAATISLLLLVYFLGFEFLEAYGTVVMPAFIRTAIAAIVFIVNGVFDPYFALLLFSGGAIGGHFGSKAAILKGNKWLKVLFTIVVIISLAQTLVG